MKTEHKGQPADNQNQGRDEKANQDPKSKNIGIKNEDLNVIDGTSGNSTTNDQPSGSQNNKWQQEHGSESAARTSQHKSVHDENHSRPAQEFSAADDDELESELPKHYRKNEYVEENELERTDQDYHDGENRSGENQDEGDELRNGK